MAERQQVVRWIRQFLSTVAVAALTAGVVSGENTGGTGACATDYCEAVPDRLESYSPEYVALRVPTGGQVQAAITGVEITTASAGDDITLTSIDDILFAPADDLTALVTDQAIVNAANFSSTVTGIFAAQTTGGGSVSTTTGGVDITAGSAGDDVSISAIDDITLTATGGPLLLLGASGQLQIDSNGGIFNGPLSAGLITGGFAYGVPIRLGQRNSGFVPGTTAETVVDTFVIPANAWTTDGEALKLRAWGVAGGNTNAKTVRLRLGTSGTCLTGSILGAINFASASDAEWNAEWIVTREGVSSQSSFARGQGSTAAGVAGTTRTVTSGSGLTETAIIDACLTVQNATSAGDLSVNRLHWDWR